MCANFIYMYIYMRYFWKNWPLWIHIQAARTWFWDVSPFRQCPATPVRPAQHGLFLKTLPDKYMCYFHIYAHIYKVVWAKLNFLTSHSGRQGRFLRCVSLSANEKPSPRHCVQQGLFLKNSSIKTYVLHSYIWTYLLGIFGETHFLTSYAGHHDIFLRCVSPAANAQPSPALCGPKGLFHKNPP